MYRTMFDIDGMVTCKLCALFGWDQLNTNLPCDYFWCALSHSKNLDNEELYMGAKEVQSKFQNVLEGHS